MVRILCRRFDSGEHALYLKVETSELLRSVKYFTCEEDKTRAIIEDFTNMFKSSFDNLKEIMMMQIELTELYYSLGFWDYILNLILLDLELPCKVKLFYNSEMKGIKDSRIARFQNDCVGGIIEETDDVPPFDENLVVKRLLASIMYEEGITEQEMEYLLQQTNSIEDFLSKI